MRPFSILFVCGLLLAASACEFPERRFDDNKSASGAKHLTVKVQTDPDGNTVEQGNVMKRLEMDNTPGSLKHLYVISPMTGDVLLYSTVQGKVTSSGKRLQPSHVTKAWQDPWHTEPNGGDWYSGFVVKLGSIFATTDEVLGDDGTYGSSAEYIYWFDQRGAYHQQFTDGGVVIHVSDQPIPIKHAIINLEELSTTPAE